MDGIEIKNLNKAFKEKVVLKNFNGFFPYGKITCITGPSGYGKTTLLSIMASLIKMDSGNIKGLENKNISMVFQEDRLCESLTAMINVQMVCKDKNNSQRIHEMFKTFGIEGCENNLISTLSGGMKRRVAIIRALVVDYDILLMDEPFKGLDNDTKFNVINYIVENFGAKTIIISTHNEEDIKLLKAINFSMKNHNFI